VGSQIGHPNPPLQISAKEEKESENQHFRSGESLTAFPLIQRTEYGNSETEPEIIACKGRSGLGPARACGAWVLKNCLEGIVFMNRRALCDKMCLCLQDDGDSRAVMQG
jgi:hypothetical protein